MNPIELEFNGHESSGSKKPTVDIIVVNWNAGSRLVECVESIKVASVRAVVISLVTVVDNGSIDSSCDQLDTVGLPLRVIRNRVNVGFAAACNQGALNSQADFLLFLNPDARLLPDSLDGAADALSNRSNGNVGILGVRLIDREGNTSRSCARRPTLWSLVGHTVGLDRLGCPSFPTHFIREWDHDDTRIVDQVIGAFFFVRRQAYEELGGFDERFFVYFEDLDFSIRALERGWKTLYLSTTSAVHYGGGTTESIKAVRLFYFWRARILYTFKHFGWMGATLVGLMSVAIEPWSRTLFLLLKKDFKDILGVWRAVWFLITDMPNWVGGNTRTPISVPRRASKARKPAGLLP